MSGDTLTSWAMSKDNILTGNKTAPYTDNLYWYRNASAQVVTLAASGTKTIMKATNAILDIMYTGGGQGAARMIIYPSGGPLEAYDTDNVFEVTDTGSNAAVYLSSGDIILKNRGGGGATFKYEVFVL